MFVLLVFFFAIFVLGWLLWDEKDWGKPIKKEEDDVGKGE